MMDSLERAFSFDSHDLSRNRQGLLSEKQSKRLRRKNGCLILFFANMFIFPAITFGLAGLFFLAIGGLAVLSEPSIIEEIVGELATIPLRSYAGLFFTAILGIGFVGFLAIAMFIGIRRARRDRIKQRVATTSGHFLIKRVTDTDYPDNLIINEIKFDIGRNQLRALQAFQGTEMTIYYLLRSRSILALEPTEQANLARSISNYDR